MSGTLETVRVFVGSEQKTEIARKVLEFSIVRRTDENIQFTTMIGRKWEYPTDLAVGTGFSLRRWMIPAYCDWQGLAIYLDADQLVLGDIGALYALARDHSGDHVIWCTHQPDKFSPRAPTPQTSVMIINCALAAQWWGFNIGKVIAHLRANPTKDAYSKFMHASWISAKLIATLPTEWNHLNVHQPGKTKLLHYTSEESQPWYKPDHPYAKLWQHELTAAMAAGKVTDEDVEHALSRWQVKEDWRPTNGLHPEYRNYLLRRSRGKTPSKLPERETKLVVPRDRDLGLSRILWVTSFDPAIFEASGASLIESFVRTGTVGTLLCCVEGKIAMAEANNVAVHNLDHDSFLKTWLKKNAGIIPTHLGGIHDGKCRCRGGPFPIHDRRHKQPCVGSWFNRNAARWFRKIAALYKARELALSGGYDMIVWIDADCVFTARVDSRAVEGWFRCHLRPRPATAPNNTPPDGVGAFYLKNKRPVIESGIFGINLRPNAHGNSILDAIFERYVSGRFRLDERWDDSFQLQRAISVAKGVRAIDLATAVDKEHAEVVQHSPLGPYIKHFKGLHGRTLGLMT